MARASAAEAHLASNQRCPQQALYAPAGHWQRKSTYGSTRDINLGDQHTPNKAQRGYVDR
eukprot:3709002-Amphidinium_carterae.1